MYVIVMVLSTFGVGTQVLVTVLILNDCQFIKLMAQSVSIGIQDRLNAQLIDSHVQELNGAHLRLTIVEVI